MNQSMAHAMNYSTTRTPRPAFALIEAALVCIALAVLLSILLVIGNKSRQTAMAGEDLANLRRIGQLTGQYAADNKELFWSFSWKKGQILSQFPDLNYASNDLQAGADQAVDIARRLTGNNLLPKITGWIPHIYYSHLPLEDYAGMKLPNRLFIGSGDRNRLLWASDIEGYNAGKFLPVQPNPIGTGWRWPYSSSFNMVPMIFSKESGSNTINQHGNNYSVFTTTGVVVGQRSTTEIAFPSEKVLLHDAHDRHHGQRQPYFAVSTGEARVPLLLVDGSADVRATKSANPGWQPQSPTNPQPTSFYYSPTEANSPWDPPALSPSGIDNCFGYYRFTRSASKGRDFGGPEVPFP
jgi:hypothetical protein